MCEPVFIVGVARSGTTLLHLMLDAHSRLAIPYESHFIHEIYKKIDSFGDLTQKGNRIELVEQILSEPFVAHWDKPVRLEDIDLDACTSLGASVDQIFSAYARASGKDIWGDKTPSLGDIDVLYELFPNGRFIHIIRDGRDVASVTC